MQKPQRLIAWDTSAKSGAIVALEWDEAARDPRASLKLVSEWVLDVQATHSERLLWGIDQVLSAARWKLADVSFFGVGIGPGSFTGLRIGITTAKSLAATLNKPLIPVSSLVALARPAVDWLAQLSDRTVIIAATDACKGEVFSLVGAAKSVRDCVMYSDGDFPGIWKRGVEEAVLTPEELIKAAKKKLREGISAKKTSSKPKSASWIALGEAFERYPEIIKALPAAQRIELPIGFNDQIQGRHLGLLAWEGLQAGLARDANRVNPRYMRAADAEIKLKAGLLPPGPTRGGSRSNS